MIWADRAVFIWHRPDKREKGSEGKILISVGTTPLNGDQTVPLVMFGLYPSAVGCDGSYIENRTMPQTVRSTLQLSRAMQISLART